MRNIILVVLMLGALTFVGCGKDTIREQKSDLQNFKIKGSSFDKFSITHEGEIPRLPFVRRVGEGVYDFRSELKTGYDYYFNQDGNIVSVYAHKGDFSVHMIYDGKREVERTIDDSYKIIFQYDDKGFLIGSKEISTFTGKESGISTFKTDAKGNIISEIFTDGLREPGTNTFEYDAQGNLIHESIEDIIEGGGFDYYYSYDAKGNLIQYKDEVDKVTFTYDADGNMISAKGQFSRELLNLTYKYVFDEKGNWVTQYIYNDGRQVAKVSRDIVYDDY